jgi:transposase
LILKKIEKTGISKREVAKLSGVDCNGVQKWNTLYLSFGIEILIIHKNIGFKPSFFSVLEHNM